MRYRKGQAAMEFLMTYGWAILVVLAAIGALAYFGVLSPARFLPSTCTAQGGFSCVEYKVTASDVQLGLINNLGADLRNVSVAIEGCTGVASLTTTTLNGDRIGGTTGMLTMDTCTNTVGGKFKGDFNITYYRTTDAVSHLATGSLTAPVES